MPSKNFFDDMFTYRPFLVGFDDVFKRIEDFNRTTAKNMMSSWPPFNVKKIGDGKYCIELAVAGFGRSDIDITMEGGTLTISGKIRNDDNEKSYIHKGIAERAFKRSFTLADAVEIKDAEIVNGLLRIYFDTLVPMVAAARKIEIK